MEGASIMNRLAIDTIGLKPAKGISTAICHIMQHDYIERITRVSAIRTLPFSKPDGIRKEMK